MRPQTGGRGHPLRRGARSTRALLRGHRQLRASSSRMSEVGEVDAITPIQSLTVGNLDMMKVTTVAQPQEKRGATPHRLRS